MCQTSDGTDAAIRSVQVVLQSHHTVSAVTTTGERDLNIFKASKR